MNETSRCLAIKAHLDHAYSISLKAMVEMGFDLNVQRDSDKCTPLHLAIFFKKPASIDTLKELGVDSTLQNTYGESCDEKYHQLAESKSNIIFLDLELTSVPAIGLDGE